MPTLKIPDELKHEVIRALENHAAYLRAYKGEPKFADELEKLAAELREK